MAAQSTASRPPVASTSSGTATGILGNVIAAVPLWARWLALFFIVNTAASSILLFSQAADSSSALDQLPLDDSWIHLVYIRAVVTEGCLCYNTGIWEAGATSWGWVLLNAPFYLVGTEWLGIDPVFVIKFVGLLTAAFGTLFAFLIVKRVTGSRNFALVAATLMALEPTFAFSRISGMEIALVVTGVLGATLAILHRRYRLAGLALSISFLARPEAGLFVAMALAVVAIDVTYRNRRTLLHLSRRLIELAASDTPSTEWVKTKRTLRRVTRSRSLLWLSIPPAASLLIWIAYNKSINGTIYPNTYLAKRDPTFGAFPIDNISTVFHWGVSHWQPWVSGWILPFSAAVYLFAVYFVVRKGRLPYLPLAAFPLLMIIAVGRSQAFGDVPMTFWARRYVDPTAPVLILTIALGAWALLAIGRSYINSRTASSGVRLLAYVPVFGTVGAIAFMSFTGGYDIWTKMHEDYSWNSRNIGEVDVAAGIWIDENLPADNSVFIADAGAIRYFGNRFTYDSIGLNYHQVIGRPPVDQIITEKPDSLAIWISPEFENLPVANRQAVFTTPRNTILGGGPVGIYTLDWELDDFGDASEILLLDTDGPVIDQINITDRESEQAHDYFVSFVAYAPNAILDMNGVVIEDRGLLHGSSEGVVERFKIDAIEGQPLTLVLRHITNERGLIQPEVRVDGVVAGRLPIVGKDEVGQETAFTIPAELITSNRVEIEVRWESPTTEFRWWAVAGAE